MKTLNVNPSFICSQTIINILPKKNMFAVVGDNNLLFSTELTSLVENAQVQSYNFQFILYASLDSLDLKDPSPFRESIDTYEGFTISAYVTPGQTTFLLLHPKKKADLIKKFFLKVHTFYAELLMNPFYDARTPIEDENFKKNVIEAAKTIITS